MGKYKEIDLKSIKTYSISGRESKVDTTAFAREIEKSDSVEKFIDSLPEILVASDFKKFIKYYQNAVITGNPVIFMMGAHLIKVGLNPLLIRAMKRKQITHLAMNGACVIHDLELAMHGQTSEDVAKGLQDGSFGMVKETAEIINKTIAGGENKLGYGESIAKTISESDYKYKDLSILKQAYDLDIPISVHIALGTEIIHQHGSAKGSAIGDTSMRDFRILCQSLTGLNANAIVINAGSAVIMPEVFLKALTVVRNLGHPAFGFTTATFDMIRHYRPTENVVKRPTLDSGKGYYFIGHHEIMLPLLLTSL